MRDDILGTLAHVAVLEKAGLLKADEAQRVRTALTELHAQAETFKLDPAHEDVHMNVEVWLTQRVGDLGKKVHTGRSRNDQVALDLRLWARRAILDAGDAARDLGATLLTAAQRNPDAILPGHTHFQIAQPVLLAHVLGAHAARMMRDLERLDQAYTRTNVSPLGAGALAGTSHPLDPALSAELLAFDRPFTNSLDAVSDRDFLHDLLYAQAVLLNHVSGLAEELILFTHPAFGFATIDDAHATGSSLMPQKKNPDALEVARAKAATAAGALAASLGHTKALPLAYNRDLQEQKRLVLETVPAGTRAVRAVASLVKTLTFHDDRMLKMAWEGYADATDLADYLVRKGVPFRDAHALAAQCVQVAIAKSVPLARLTLKEFKAISPKVSRDVFTVLGPEASVAAKKSPGGTGRDAAAKALESVWSDLEKTGRSFKANAQALQKATLALLPPALVKRKATR